MMFISNVAATMATCQIIFILFVFSIEILQSRGDFPKKLRVKRSEQFVVKLPTVIHSGIDSNLTKKSEKTENQIVVQTVEGKVKGYHREVNGYKCYSFYGIPYGTIPARFQAATPAKPWKGILDGTKITPPCMQIDYKVKQIGGVEDCLSLEVHTMNVTGKRPVIFSIHGGVFVSGSPGQFEMIRLTNQNVVVVSIAYRLGVFGFLSTGTKHAPGNLGLKDAVLALRWVQKNIHNFGGDPNNVCLYGCSSGAAMVDFLTLNPHAKGLFSSVFSQSGSVIPKWSLKNDIELNTVQLARMFGVTSLDWDIIIDKLKNVTAKELVMASEKLGTEAEGFTVFRPCLEKVIEGEESAIVEYPKDILKNGNYIDVPFMLSFTDLEGSATLHEHTDFDGIFKSIENDISWYLPHQFIPNMLSRKKLLNAYSSFYEYYFKEQRPSRETFAQVIDFLGDIRFYHMFNYEFELRNNTSKSPIYALHFAFDSDYSAFHKSFINISGVGHAEDLAYYVDIPTANINARTPPTIKLVSERVVKMLANFAEFHNPTPTKTKLLPVKFLPFQSSPKGCYLKVNDKLEMKYGFYHSKSYNFAKKILMKMQSEIDL